MKQRNRIVFGDLIYNYTSVAITAICGAVFSIIVGYYYDASVLGRFNTVYAYYIVLSQFCVCGIQMAIVRYAAEGQTKEFDLGLLIKSISVCIISSVIIIILGTLITNLILASYLGSSMITSINTIWIALLFFSVNKVFLGWLNGHSKMRAYAFFQASRNLIIACCLLVFALVGIPGELLTYCFLVSEAIQFAFELIFLVVNRKKIRCTNSKVRFLELLSFGVRILPSNAVLELNTKIDVICLSLILNNERLVGIYSFAAMFGEGFYQLFIVIRKILNPKITQQQLSHTLKDYIVRIKDKYFVGIYIGFTMAWGMLMSGFIVIVKVMGKIDYYSGLWILCILCIAMILNSKSIIFGDILSQTGFPFDESILNIATAASNGILNVFLIIHFNVIGAALATGLSYFVYSFIQKYQVRRKLGISL